MTFSFFARTQKYLYIILTVMLLAGISFRVDAAKDGFTVVIDPGHGGNDHGAIDNKAREKDINLAVGKRLGELLRKKQKDIDVVFTRDDDTFVSLQGRADIANKAKGDLFISIHTNSVDAKNKNRTTVAGASVYTLGNHKDDANMGGARRENSVIELEDGYKQKYSCFDPSKD
ncbi:MAG: N-acetylmuramoyl-L-alanine amidase, partial [Muribaculaceae bacterium]|nr:N-acetylmuramoyl-L-alanine amidase [Muribaculaceae bacterium]